MRIVSLMSRSNADAEKWSAKHRVGSARLNTYLFGPKDDDGTRVSWRDLLSDSGVARLRRTARCCEAHGVRFVVALHIGDEVMFALDDANASALRARVQQLRDDCGAHGVALFFDDVALPLDAFDNDAIWSTDAKAAKVPQDSVVARAWYAAARTQAAAFDAALDAWGSKSDALFMLCPSAYYTNDPREHTDVYLRTLGSHLAAKVDVLWTGDEIVSRQLLRSSVAKANELLQRRVLVFFFCIV